MSRQSKRAFRVLLLELELYGTNWLAINILLLTIKKCFLSNQGLVGAGMNCRALIIHLNLLQIPDPMDFVKPFRRFERNG